MRVTFGRWLLLGTGLVACVASLSPTGGLAANELRLLVGSHGVDLLNQTADAFAEATHEITAGELTIEVFSASDMGIGPPDMAFEMLRAGQVDIALIPNWFIARLSDAFSFLELPYIVTSREHAREIVSEIVLPELGDELRDYGVEILAMSEIGFRFLTTTSVPVTVPEDLKGLKIRTAGHPWYQRAFETFGARPVAISWGEVYTALQAGVVDAQETYVFAVEDARIYETQSNLALSYHGYSMAFLLINADTWEGLSSDAQSALEEAALVAQEFSFSEGERAELETIDRLRSHGLNVTDVDHMAFQEASKYVFDEFASTVPGGGELIANSLRLQ